MTINLPFANDATRRRDLDLAKMPAPSRKLSREEWSKNDAKHNEQVESLTDVDIHLLGLARTVLPAAMREAATAIENIERDLKKERSEIGGKLLKRLGINDDLPGSVASVNDLPDALRNQLSGALTNDWSALGFSSQQEAESFMANCNKISITTWVGIIQCVNPGDPQNHLPGSYRGDLFIGIRGPGNP